MKIYREISAVRNLKNVCVTLGTFDGIHLGHRMILDRLKKVSGLMGGESMVITFDPHPRIALGKDAEKLRFITTLDEKIERLSELDIDHLLIVPFTNDFAALSAEDFIDHVLLGQLNAVRVVVGYDHHFGKPGASSQPIDVLLKQKGIKVDYVEQFVMNGRPVSSTKIRLGLQEGRVDQAAECLGYHYTLKAVVEDGHKVGRKMGFPTANLRVADIKKVIPKNGVYAVRAMFKGKYYKGMMNIGNRPTLTEGHYSLEVHLLDFEGDLYGKEIEVSFIHFIRDEQKFASMDELTKQIGKDKQAIQNLDF